MPRDNCGTMRHYRRMSKTDLLNERIQARLYELGLTEREASLDATGKADAIRYIRTRAAMPSAERLQAIAATLRTSPEWLLGGEGPVQRAPAPPLAGEARAPAIDVADFRKFPKNLPIYGTALGSDLELHGTDGSTQAIEQTDIFMSEPRDYMARPTLLAGRNHMYVVEVAGHSMEPRFDAGRRVLVDGKKPPRVGDDVIVQLRCAIDNEEEVAAVLIKQLVRQKAGAIILRQFNPATEFEVPMERVKQLHTIVPWDDVLSF